MMESIAKVRGRSVGDIVFTEDDFDSAKNYFVEAVNQLHMMHEHFGKMLEGLNGRAPERTRQNAFAFRRFSDCYRNFNLDVDRVRRKVKEEIGEELALLPPSPVVFPEVVAANDSD